MGTQRPVLDLGPMTGDENYIRARIESLVETFSTLLQKRLELREAKAGHTDCESFIAVPLHEYDAYLVAEHEISHCVFETDLALTKQMTDDLVERLLRRAKWPLTAPEAQPYRPKLAQLIHDLWNVLEDHRICGLWGELYPGGSSLLRQRWHDISEHVISDEDAKKSLIRFLARFAAGVPTDTAPDAFKRCEAPMQRALNLVEGVDAAACLAVTARLVDEIADELLETHPPDKADAAKQKVEQLAQGVDPQDVGTDPTQGPQGMGQHDVQSPAGKQKRVSAAQKIQVKRLMTARDDDNAQDPEGMSSFQKLMQEGAHRMEERLEAARQAMSSPKKTEDSTKTAIQSAAALAGIPVVFAEATRTLPRPTPTAKKIRYELERLRMKRRRKNAYEGDDLNVEELLDTRLSGANIYDSRIFTQVKRESGLDLLLLVDTSGSMAGHGMALAERAIADTVHGCQSSTVNVHLWCYSSQLFVFKKVGSPVGAKNLSMQWTAMIQALEVAKGWAAASKKTKGIIHITDGMPTSLRAKNSSGNTLQDLRQVLDEIHKEGIVLTNLAIGQRQNQEVYEKGFGKGNFSLLSSVQDLATALPETGRKLVEAHVRRTTR